MHIRLSSVVIAACGLATAGVAAVAIIVAAGWYNVAALDPHPKPVTHLLHTAMREAVQYYSRSIVAPDLDDPALANRAAGHFDTRCAPCHGAPGVARDQAGMAIYPMAPDLSSTVPEWEAAELFWIVKYGIKLSGMPAWGPTHRDDEIWSLVAFLQRLPQMSPRAYHEATNAALDDVPHMAESIDAGAEVARAGVAFEGATACARCHGLDGAGLPDGGIPRLSGQDAAYLSYALESFAIGFRRSGIMEPIAQAMTPAQRRAVADYYSGINAAPVPEAPVANEALLQLGAALAAIGAPERGVPPCASCHGGTGSRPLDGVPAIAGQFADYMDLQFNLWRNGQRGAGPEGAIMQRLALTLTDREIEAVTLFYASLRDAPGRLARD